MAFINMNIFSESLGKATSVNVIIPQKRTAGLIGVENKLKKNKDKCLYLLHGLSDDYSIWERRTAIERYADIYGITVVMPDGGRSFYSDMKYGGNYYTYIAKELPKIMQEIFNISDKREDNFIAGLSMGGYGALKIALKECGRYSKVAGLSSVADIEKGREMFPDDIKNIYGEDEIPDDDNLFKLIEKRENKEDKPEIFMAVGTEDFLYEDNIKLRDFIKKKNYKFIYKEGKGEHTWIFWDEYIKEILRWMFL